MGIKGGKETAISEMPANSLSIAPLLYVEEHSLQVQHTKDDNLR